MPAFQFSMEAYRQNHTDRIRSQFIREIIMMLYKIKDMKKIDKKNYKIVLVRFHLTIKYGTFLLSSYAPSVQKFSAPLNEKGTDVMHACIIFK
jgi:hypothetical protein